MAYPVGAFQGSPSSQTSASNLQEVQVIPGLLGDVCVKIFRFLNAEELARTALVCKQWSVLVSSNELQNRAPFPSWFKLIDASVWENHVDMQKYGLDVTGAPPLDRRTLTKALKPLSRRVENNKGITIMTSPKGLTGNKVLKFAADPKISRPVPIDYISPLTLEPSEDTEDEQTQLLFFTNSIFEGTKGSTCDQHMLDMTTIGQECRVTIRRPRFREFMALLALTSMSSSEDPPTQLYSSNTYARLKETYAQFTFSGGFTSSGLRVDADRYFDDDEIGIGACGDCEGIGTIDLVSKQQ